MGNFSRDTFDKLKHYVGVRLQQGVPLVDADWNEQEDIRRYELQAFLKWFVGNGVPEGNDGFRILPVTVHIPHLPGPHVPVPHVPGPHVPVPRVPVPHVPVPPLPVWTANDFIIKGGDGKGAGRCLVEGWDVINESDLRYTEQPLYNNGTLAREWGVEPVEPLTTPTVDRTDTVYLDVWEREVDDDEDDNLVNPDIGVETCVRLKREWVVRVAQATSETTLDAPPGGHVYYPLATLEREAEQATIKQNYIGDLRRTGVAVSPEEITIKDGNVGIGKSPEAAKLHIAGNLKLDIGEGLEFLGDNNYFEPNKDARIFRMIDTNGTRGRVDGGIAIEGFTSTDNTRRQIMTIRGNGKVGIGTPDPSEKLTISEGDLKIEGGPYRRLKIVSDDYWAGIELVAREMERNGHPYIDFTHGGLDDPNYGIRIYAPTNDRFVIEGGNVGIGTTNPGDDKLDVRGRCYSSDGWHMRNADYAEYFESFDGSEIPVGTSVTLTKDVKIGPAKKGDVPIGIITTNSAIVGNSYKEWPKKYLRDEFGNQIMEEYKEEVMIPKKEKIEKERKKVEKKTITEEVTRTEIVLEKGKYIQKEISESIASEIEEPLFEEVDVYDATGKKVIGKHKVPVMETYEKEIDVLDENGEPVLVGSGEFVTKERPKLNPEYDESQEYVSREQRQEWNCVGLLGQLPLRKGQLVAPTWIKIKDISKEVELWLVR